MSTAQQKAYGDGEWFKFRVHYGFVTAGYATLEVNQTTLRGKQVYHIKGFGETVGASRWFFKVEDDYQSFVDIIEKNGENDIAKLDFEKEGLTIGVNFGNYTTEWAHEEKINQMIDWLFESNNWSFENKDMFLDLDIQRLFSKELKENTLTKQGYVCYIDGTKLDMEEAEAAHITAWSAGGRTTPDNIAMVHKKYNQDMGTMNVEEYKIINGYA